MKKRKKSERTAGRPPEFTDEVVKKLEESFSIDATVEEACFYADISRQSYYNNVKEGTALFDRFKALRERPVLLARQTAVSKITESYANAMDYLKRKRKTEFGDESRVEMKISKPFEITDEQKAILDNL
jgi:predicted DNA-binding protein YlxM (UPF0122 family)